MADTAHQDPAPAPAWRPIAHAETLKDGKTVILARFHPDLADRMGAQDEDRRRHLDRWSGLQVLLRHPGLADDGFDIGWNIAAPVGVGGFSDDYIAGWMYPPAPDQDAIGQAQLEGFIAGLLKAAKQVGFYGESHAGARAEVLEIARERLAAGVNGSCASELIELIAAVRSGKPLPR